MFRVYTYIHRRVFGVYKLTRVFVGESINLTKCTTLNQSNVFLSTPSIAFVFYYLLLSLLFLFINNQQIFEFFQYL